MPSVLLKLDLAKAFDSVSWPYILDIMRAMGFGARWCEWIALILSSSSLMVLVNGVPTERIWHKCGFRQGDPLSPFLFIIAMEPLHRIFDMAKEQGMLPKLRGRAATMRTSLYADDLALFVNPIQDDMRMVGYILETF